MERCMILSHEAQQTLLLLARRRINKPEYEFWGYSNTETGEWTCLACGRVFSKEELVIKGEDIPTHIHGLECLKNHNLIAFL